jgi:hypothetical protein
VLQDNNVERAAGENAEPLKLKLVYFGQGLPPLVPSASLSFKECQKMPRVQVCILKSGSMSRVRIYVKMGVWQSFTHTP